MNKQNLERNRNVYNKSLTRMFFILNIVLLLVFVFKIFFVTCDWYCFIVESMALLLGVGYGIGSLGKKEDIKYEIYAKAFRFQYNILMVGAILTLSCKADATVWNGGMLLIVVCILLLFGIVWSRNGKLPYLHRDFDEIKRDKKNAQILMFLDVFLIVFLGGRAEYQWGSQEGRSTVLIKFFMAILFASVACVGIARVYTQEEKKLMETMRE